MTDIDVLELLGAVVELEEELVGAAGYRLPCRNPVVIVQAATSVLQARRLAAVEARQRNTVLRRELQALGSKIKELEDL